MERPVTPPPSAGELHAFSLGKCQPHRAAEIEAFLKVALDVASVLDSAPDDTLLRSLRGTGALTRAIASFASWARAAWARSTLPSID